MLSRHTTLRRRIFFPAEDGIRDLTVTGVQTCALPICDFRISATGTHKIGLNETPIGLAFPPGAFEISRLGLRHSSFGRAILEGELHDPARALEMGYLHEVVAPERVADRCLELARKVSAYPAGAYAYNKAMMQKPALERCLNEPESEKQRRAEVWTSQETLEAFLARAQGLSKKA